MIEDALSSSSLVLVEGVDGEKGNVHFGEGHGAMVRGHQGEEHGAQVTAVRALGRVQKHQREPLRTTCVKEKKSSILKIGVVGRAFSCGSAHPSSSTIIIAEIIHGKQEGYSSRDFSQVSAESPSEGGHGQSSVVGSAETTLLVHAMESECG